MQQPLLHLRASNQSNPICISTSRTEAPTAVSASQISTSLCKLRAHKALQTTTMTTAPSSSTSAPMEDESNPGAEAGIILLLPAAGGTKALPSEAVPATKAQSSSSATMAANLFPATGAVAYTKTGPSEAVPATKAPSSSSATTAANLVPATGAVAHTKAGTSEAALFWVSGTSPLAGSRGWMTGPSFLNPEQLKLAPPSSPERANHLYKTRLCVYDRENCPDGENCEFAHSEAEIRLPTRLIDGVCRYGEGCPYGARCFYRYH